MTIDELINNKKKKLDEMEKELILTIENEVSHINNCLNIISGYKQEIKWLEELKSKRKMLDFLFNEINPNDMEVYMRMYDSTDVKEAGENNDD